MTPRYLLAGTGAVTVLAASFAGLALATPVTPASKSIEAAAAKGTRVVKATTSNTWSPASLTVRRGTTVRFTWDTPAPHNVRKTSGKGKALKTGVSPKGSGTFKVPAKGTYRFVCDVHAGTMKVTVKAR